MSPSSACAVAGLGLAVALAACAPPSEQEIKARFAEYVAGANQCTVASECALAGTDCPLGCYVAVRGDRKADVEARARELVDDYQGNGHFWSSHQGCAYDCVPPGPITCTAGRCAVAPYGFVPDAGAAPVDSGVD
jgi:hypothetical protein